MDATVERVCAELDQIATSIAGWTEDRTFAEANGWNTVALTKRELAAMFSDLSARLKTATETSVTPALAEKLPVIEARLRVFRSQSLQYLLNGNATGVMGPIALLLDWLRSSLDPKMDWETLPNDVLPQALRRRLRATKSSLDLLEPDIAKLSEQISEIKAAHDAALALPTDLQALEEATKKIEETAQQSALALADIDNKTADAKVHLEALKAAREEADRTIDLAQKAYSAATSSGLAAAFDERSKRFTTSMWGCVVGLVAALAIGSYIGSTRIAALSYALRTSEGTTSILTELLYSVLSIGAPLWFAWLMTKQIGQRFRLAEDYGYKASVARAYEGFRREAVRIDPAFEARLFATALTRLEEPPLRLVETVTHGSPYQELLSSEVFRRAMDQIPELKDLFIGFTKSKAGKPGKLSTPPEAAASPGA